MYRSGREQAEEGNRTMRQQGLKHHPATKVQRGSGWSSDTRIQGRFVSHNTVKESEGDALAGDPGFKGKWSHAQRFVFHIKQRTQRIYENIQYAVGNLS